MVLLICRWTDADVPGGLTTFRPVRRPLQRTSGLSPQSSEVCDLHRGHTSCNTALCDRPPSIRWRLPVIWRAANYIHRSIHLEHGAPCRRGPRLVLCEAAPAKSVEVWDHLIRDSSHDQTSWNTNLSLHVEMDTVTPSNVMHDLGILLDSKVTMRQYISKIVDVCFYHLRCLKKNRRILGSSITCRLSLHLLRVASNTAMRFWRAFHSQPSHRCNESRMLLTSSQRELHWLPIWYQIIFKLCLMTHNADVGRCPHYIIEPLSPIANMPNCGRLCLSVSSKYEFSALRLKIGKRAFSYSGPAF